MPDSNAHDLSPAALAAATEESEIHYWLYRARTSVWEDFAWRRGSVGGLTDSRPTDIHPAGIMLAEAPAYSSAAREALLA